MCLSLQILEDRRRSVPAPLVKASDFVVDDQEDEEKPEISDEETEKLKAQALRAVVQAGGEGMLQHCTHLGSCD
eukprot:g12723.t1